MLALSGSNVGGSAASGRTWRAPAPFWAACTRSASPGLALVPLCPSGHMRYTIGSVRGARITPLEHAGPFEHCGLGLCSWFCCCFGFGRGRRRAHSHRLDPARTNVLARFSSKSDLILLFSGGARLDGSAAADFPASAIYCPSYCRSIGFTVSLFSPPWPSRREARGGHQDGRTPGPSVAAPIALLSFLGSAGSRLAR